MIIEQIFIITCDLLHFALSNHCTKLDCANIIYSYFLLYQILTLLLTWASKSFYRWIFPCASTLRSISSRSVRAI